jgi:glycerate 2-kinase
VPQVFFGEHQQHLQRVIEAVLRAVDPGEALVRHWPQDEAVAAALRGGVLVAAGKASVSMTIAAVERLGVRPSTGVLLAPAGVRAPSSLHAGGVRVFEVDHPLPTQRNLIAARAAGDAARLASSRKVPLVVFLSGGASAHLTVPDRGLTLSDVRTITDVLLKSGAAIEEVNAVRQCCETLKAGGLARFAAPSPVHAFILSDVLGDPEPIGVIASGPTANVQRSPAAALRVLESRHLTAAVPTITAHIQAQIKAPVVVPPVTNAINTVIGSNVTAVLAARSELESLGFRILETRMSVDGNAATRGRELAALLRTHRERNPDRGGGPVAVVWGGETTVNVGAAGASFGGRNQEAALAAALALEASPAAAGTAVMCFATDGIDGNPPPTKPAHAGAIVTGDSAAAARRAGVDPAAALAAHGSYAFATAAEAAIKTGPTGTNVNDVWVGLAY